MNRANWILRLVEWRRSVTATDIIFHGSLFAVWCWLFWRVIEELSQ